MFGKSKRPKDTMSVKDMTRLDKRPLKYVTMRDPETYKEVRLGENGAVNIMDGDFVLVCLGRDVAVVYTTISLCPYILPIAITLSPCCTT